jgi:hypothetical protein
LEKNQKKYQKNFTTHKKVSTKTKKSKKRTQHVVGVHCVDRAPVEEVNDALHELPGQSAGVGQNLPAAQLNEQAVHELVPFPLVCIQRLLRLAVEMGNVIFKKIQF